MKYDLTAERAAYNALKSVYTEKAYSSIELDRALGQVAEGYRGRVTALVYGVLEKNYTLDYYISSLTDKKPKSNIELLLKLAIYDLVFGIDKEYAVIDKFVSFARDRFGGAHGFVNAVLRKAKSIELPTGDDTASLSVNYNCAPWLIDRLLRDYGDRAYALIKCDPDKRTHIRYNSRAIDKQGFEKLLAGTDYSESELGYFVSRSTLKSLPENVFTAQSLASMKAANKYVEGLDGHLTVLDLCAAPGGKSIYIEELRDADITACDVHKHRVNLIRSYALRMGSKLNAVENDALTTRKEWLDAYDLVICDVPCSGSGLFKSSPDIMLFKSDKDVEQLAALQSAILTSAARYVKKGGTLVYSTCSLFKTENDHIADNFSASHDTFCLMDKIMLFPDADGCDGFFIARWKKN